MAKPYSIIIPIFNEKLKIPSLLEFTKEYSCLGHEILIVNDGSNDGSKEILSKCNFIKLINFEKNKGKGEALKRGLTLAKNNKIIIFDGDLELDPNDIRKLMILDKNKSVNSVFANRFGKSQPKSIWNLGNWLFTLFFNLLYNVKIKDALCCAKAFFKNDLNLDNIKSKKFNIDIELTSKLIKLYPDVKNINIQYNRRNISQGKKLRFKDSLSILITMIQNRV